ncbi:MAG TPA: carbonic anhydrase [Candidatus Acidoferrales bacterium]|nr:carbonic anhydrase [Candidatus Acidoferrales bacterium]
MSIIDDALKANESYSNNFRLGNLLMPPAKKLAVVACMDARLTIEPMLGLQTGEAHIIRNAGGIVTEDAVRSLVISHHLLGTREFAVINHADCGMLTFTDEDLHSRLHKKTGTAAVSPAAFHSFRNVEENVRRQVEKLRAHPWIPKDVPIRGFVYDEKTGRLKEVSESRTAAAD